jgi:hypothetical protein
MAFGAENVSRGGNVTQEPTLKNSLTQPPLQRTERMKRSSLYVYSQRQASQITMSIL